MQVYEVSHICWIFINYLFNSCSFYSLLGVAFGEKSIKSSQIKQIIQGRSIYPLLNLFLIPLQVNSGSKLHGKNGITKEWSLKIWMIDEKELPLHYHTIREKWESESVSSRNNVCTVKATIH